MLPSREFKSKAAPLLLLLLLAVTDPANNPLHALLQALAHLRRASLHLPRAVTQGIQVEDGRNLWFVGWGLVLVARARDGMDNTQGATTTAEEQTTTNHRKGHQYVRGAIIAQREPRLRKAEKNEREDNVDTTPQRTSAAD